MSTIRVSINGNDRTSDQVTPSWLKEQIEGRRATSQIVCVSAAGFAIGEIRCHGFANPHPAVMETIWERLSWPWFSAPSVGQRDRLPRGNRFGRMLSGYAGLD